MTTPENNIDNINMSAHHQGKDQPINNNYIQADAAKWSDALAGYHATQTASEAWLAAKLRLLRMPAPDLEALRQKLEILWGPSLLNDDEDAQARRLMIGDLRRF